MRLGVELPSDTKNQANRYTACTLDMAAKKDKDIATDNTGN